MRTTQCREYESTYLIFFNFLNQEGWTAVCEVETDENLGMPQR